jgi:hypothetical protein
VEDLAGTGHRYGAGGVRADDMALRLKYAGVDAEWAEPDFDRALTRLVDGARPGETVLIVPTYTAMLALLERLLPDTHRREAWT